MRGIYFPLTKAETMCPAIHLQELARQVRGSTLQALDLAEESWLTWSPPGTSNHILWHAGHALWVQDVLCIRPLAGLTELPPGWADVFGSGSRPFNSATNWPSRKTIRKKLEAQLERILSLMDDYATRIACLEPNPPNGWSLTRGIIHGLHDEARHDGEMYLLLKLCRSRQQRD